MATWRIIKDSRGTLQLLHRDEAGTQTCHGHMADGPQGLRAALEYISEDGRPRPGDAVFFPNGEALFFARELGYA